MLQQTKYQTKCPTANSTFAIGGGFVVNESSVLRIKYSAEKPRHRKSANR